MLVFIFTILFIFKSPLIAPILVTIFHYWEENR
jgi:hypothetical protein